MKLILDLLSALECLLVGADVLVAVEFMKQNVFISLGSRTSQGTSPRVSSQIGQDFCEREHLHANGQGSNVVCISFHVGDVVHKTLLFFGPAVEGSLIINITPPVVSGQVQATHLSETPSLALVHGRLSRLVGQVAEKTSSHDLPFSKYIATRLAEG